MQTINYSFAARIDHLGRSLKGSAQQVRKKPGQLAEARRPSSFPDFRPLSSVWAPGQVNGDFCMSALIL
ncbi:hypothetical protein ACWF94_31720, partial [Streptomyces sp. NPDC055078]